MSVDEIGVITFTNNGMPLFNLHTVEHLLNLIANNEQLANLINVNENDDVSPEVPEINGNDIKRIEELPDSEIRKGLFNDTDDKWLDYLDNAVRWRTVDKTPANQLYNTHKYGTDQQINGIEKLSDFMTDLFKGCEVSGVRLDMYSDGSKSSQSVRESTEKYTFVMILGASRDLLIKPISGGVSKVIKIESGNIISFSPKMNRLCTYSVPLRSRVSSKTLLIIFTLDPVIVSKDNDYTAETQDPLLNLEEVQNFRPITADMFLNEDRGMYSSDDE